MRTGDNGPAILRLTLPDVRCGGCVAAVERALNARSDVLSARVNLTLHRVTITLADVATDPAAITEALAALGYPAQPIGEEHQPDDGGRVLLRALAVAGFGSMNVMLLSVAVWAGADGATRETFHLLAALVAVPVVAYAGQPFFQSAFGVLRRGRLNMDVPIALAVVLALALSVHETVRGGDHVFFDAAVTLLFFLLAGRYLDHLMRARARSAVTALSRLTPNGAMVRQPDGTTAWTPLEEVSPGAVVEVGIGDRVPVDVRVLAGASDVDRSLVTGEAMSAAVEPGAELEAGILNLTGAVEGRVLRPFDQSFLAEMTQMLSTVEAGRRGTYVGIADRAARLYAPVVHLLALITFIGWLLVTGDWRTSIFVAISVLIITCPCALGLAVPAVHVVAAGRLMREGVLMKDGSALERLAEIDRAVFDKTGTLTTGTPCVSSVPGDRDTRSAAKALAEASSHPAARAIAEAIAEPSADVREFREIPGFGIEGIVAGRLVRLGRGAWVDEISDGAQVSGPAFAFEDGEAVAFTLSETLRPNAREAVAAVAQAGVPVSMLSGDNAGRATHVARALGIGAVRAGVTPTEKVKHLEALRHAGDRVLMVGDGLNDTAALAAAHVSMAPSSASDAGRTAASFVFLRTGLDAVPKTLAIARAAATLVRQNFALSLLYNVIAIPLAVAGLVTPLIAAIAMSASSITVVANALRLNRLVEHAPGAAHSQAVTVAA